jgi:alkylation response protein AidB-like acyl-CoA dehydrogenase
MDLSYSEEYERFRAEVQAFLNQHWPPQGEEAELSFEEKCARFRERAIAAGYLARSIPRKYGGSEQEPDVLKVMIIAEEFGKAQAPQEITGIAGPHPARARRGVAEGEVHPSHHPRRDALVSGLQRARRRERPGLAPDQGDARR